MTNKITPQQAFEAARVLWPNCSHIVAKGSHGFIFMNETDYIAAEVYQTIHWPEGVEKWPMPEPKWRDATFEDAVAEKEARFRDSSTGVWHFSTISGFSRMGEYRWESSSDTWWRFCQVQDEVSS